MSVSFKKIMNKTMPRSTKKLQRKDDSLKSPKGDSPQNQQRNGSLGFIKNEVYVQKCKKNR